MPTRCNGNNRQCNNTLKFATRYRINQEIKSLYIKKAKINQQLYNKHLDLLHLVGILFPHNQRLLLNDCREKESDLELTDNIIRTMMEINWRIRRSVRRCLPAPVY